MSAEMLPMRKLREIIRLRLEAGLSGRAIARSCNLSSSTISEYIGPITAAKLTRPFVCPRRSAMTRCWSASSSRGDGLDIVDPLTGECRLAKLFVAVLGASNLT